MNSEIGSLILRIPAGILIGVMFYGGLWLTVSRLTRTSSPVLLSVTSLFLRMGLLLVSIWYLSGGRASGILGCTIGLMASRILLTRTSLLTGDRQEHTA